MTDDDFADSGFAESLELRSLLKQMRLPADFDPYRVIRLPSDEKWRETISVTVRMSKKQHHEIEQFYGHGRRFKNRTEFVLHYMAVAMYIERALAPEEDAIRSILDMAIARIELENHRIEMANIDAIIKMAEEDISSSSQATKSLVRLELGRARRVCEMNGDDRRVQTIDHILDR
jgi:hypothetical protein